MCILPHSISAQVYSTLKREILEGILPPGERLIVMDIAGRFQISQAPVREALERLKQEGLIIGKANKGSVVANVTAKEIHDVYILRGMLEVFAVRKTMPLLTEGDLLYLEDVVCRMGEAIERNDLMKTVEIDTEFHGFFYKNCGNHAILKAWEHMSAKVMWFMAISNKRHSTDKLAEGHMALIQSLRSGNVGKAEKHFLEHIKHAHIGFI
ncbi:GntR family transcriptional regulator [Gordoniibacillus kamchatkensis]|uniref:GntR family transcriptional regulator n=2 Tax=Gordoniibacillus kamchatkensis TaxID=1590651 RepID=A0ABR5AHT1_9BACL|nr:GntR family transcriptional regulator [Paenibacillus sp. VKM B-2647]